MGSRIREDNRMAFTGGGSSWGRRGWGGDGFPHPSSRGQALRGGTGGCTPILTFPHERGKGKRRGGGMGSRIRFYGGGHSATDGRERGKGWVPASVFMGAGSPRGGRGWVPASAEKNGWGRGRKDGVPASVFRWRCGWEDGMGSRLLFAGTTGGMGSLRFYGAGNDWRGQGWVPASEQRMEGWIPAPRGGERGGFPHSSRGRARVGDTGGCTPILGPSPFKGEGKEGGDGGFPPFYGGGGGWVGHSAGTGCSSREQ